MKIDNVLSRIDHTAVGLKIIQFPWREIMEVNSNFRDIIRELSGGYHSAIEGYVFR